MNNTTLLHFLERTVNKHFPDMEEFLEELAKPAEAYRGILFASTPLSHINPNSFVQSACRNFEKALRNYVMV